MKTKIKRYICKSVVAALALMTISSHTLEAAIQNSPDAEKTTVSYEMVESRLYEASLPNTKDIKAYRRYINKYLSSNKKYPEHRAVACDINGDGIYEMLFLYNRGIGYTCKIYTYKKGKIIKMKELNGYTNMCYNESDKQICCSFPNGASHTIFGCYKMTSTRLKQVAKYEAISITNYSDRINKQKYYKNGKRISAKEFKTFFNKFLDYPAI